MFAVKSLCFYVTRLKGLLYTKKIILIIFEKKTVFVNVKVNGVQNIIVGPH